MPGNTAPRGATIEIAGLTKRFGHVTAVDDLTFSVHPGRVTGFLGPNGAGKTTTLRMLLGLVRPTSGRATFDGVRYRRLSRPLMTVGAALEASSFHPGRSARDHLRVYAQAGRVPASRVSAALATVGLAAHADRRVGGYSLGMRQRLGLAFALLGDPGVLVLDEPINGLDPEGIRWIRQFLRRLAAEGRTVLVSSHLLSEVQQSVDDVIVIAKGRLVYAGELAGLASARGRAGQASAPAVIVDSPTRDVLAHALADARLAFEQTGDGFLVSGADAASLGHLAFTSGIELSQLRPATQAGAIEDTFIELVGEGGL
ncbi:ATP-binding cassette domain-containing protein [Gryllotalpicola daejeonensis]|uniref:ATP-binding cassette domain-containing protein n=1 Tax=Gryllotalpicola daejeonensis TaxID=993087 RepID=A0ABP7ZLF8_9MICO